VLPQNTNQAPKPKAAEENHNTKRTPKKSPPPPTLLATAQEPKNKLRKSQQEKQAKAIQSISHTVDFIKSQFGFIADPQNTRIHHNLAILLLSLPFSLLLARPKIMAYHNLCEHKIPPPKLQSLLGIGLNFCLQPFTSTPRKTIDTSLERFH
jgi:hypothetical protein